MIDGIRTPPTTLRVKRKRGQDPLHALLVDSLKKNNKNAYVFTFAGTEETQPAKNDTVLLEEHMRQAGTQKRRQSVSTSVDENDPDGRRVFRLPRAKKQKRRQSSDAGVSAALTDMVQNYLQMEPSSSSDKPVVSSQDLPPAIDEDTEMASEDTSNMKGPLADSLDPDAEVEDYVYDIYYRHRNAATTSYEGQRIGFIVLDADEQLLFNEDDDDSDAAAATDDEDSNAEDFYRNDYPDDDEVSSIDSEDVPRFGNEFFDDRFATKNANDEDYFAGDYGPSDDEDQRKPWDKQKSIPEEDEWSEDEDGADRDRLFSQLEHYVENR
ncbi:hypothetical protein CJU89_6835 [Yarrowia sp. B02]|nr:hypothetical protein CJU89_6835 [Yarrowia sp. B02]